MAVPKPAQLARYNRYHCILLLREVNPLSAQGTHGLEAAHYRRRFDQ